MVVIKGNVIWPNLPPTGRQNNTKMATASSDYNLGPLHLCCNMCDRDNINDTFTSLSFAFDNLTSSQTTVVHSLFNRNGISWWELYQQHRKKRNKNNLDASRIRHFEQGTNLLMFQKIETVFRHYHAKCFPRFPLL